MMKLLFVTSGMFTVPNVQGGSVETLLTHLIDINEAEHRADITVACRDNEQAQRLAQNYRYTRFIFYSRWNLSFPVRAARVINYRFWGLFHRAVPKYLYSRQVLEDAAKSSYDWIIVEEGDCYSFDIFAEKFGRDHMLAHTHSSWPANEKYHSIYGYGIVPSEYTKRTLIDRRWKDYESTVHVVPNCVSEKQFTGRLSAQQNADLKSRLGISDQYVLLYVGRINRDKGIEGLIQAMDSLHGCVLILAGSALLSYRNNDPFERRIAGMVKDRSDIIQTGYIPYAEISQYYSIADAVVSPGHAGDSCCLVNLEAMMMGVPVISSIDGGIPEYVKDGRNGFLVDTAHTVPDIIRYVEKLRNDPQLAEQISRNNREDARMFSRESYYRNMMDCLESIRK